eukprot:2500602-Lingulodinium_polyedra.AAC.1
MLGDRLRAMLAGWGVHLVHTNGHAHFDRRGRRQLDYIAVPAGTSHNWTARVRWYGGISDHAMLMLHARANTGGSGRTRRQCTPA